MTAHLAGRSGWMVQMNGQLLYLLCRQKTDSGQIRPGHFDLRLWQIQNFAASPSALSAVQSAAEPWKTEKGQPEPAKQARSQATQSISIYRYIFFYDYLFHNILPCIIKIFIGLYFIYIYVLVKINILSIYLCINKSQYSFYIFMYTNLFSRII